MERYKIINLLLGYFALMFTAGANAEFNTPLSGLSDPFDPIKPIHDGISITTNQKHMPERKQNIISLSHSPSDHKENSRGMNPHHDILTESHQSQERSLIWSHIDHPIPHQVIHVTGGALVAGERNDYLQDSFLKATLSTSLDGQIDASYFFSVKSKNTLVLMRAMNKLHPSTQVRKLNYHKELRNF
jgi:hypothetical protein